jgi:hypothetical protein
MRKIRQVMENVPVLPKKGDHPMVGTREISRATLISTLFGKS